MTRAGRDTGGDNQQTLGNGEIWGTVSTLRAISASLLVFHARAGWGAAGRLQAAPDPSRSPPGEPGRAGGHLTGRGAAGPPQGPPRGPLGLPVLAGPR